MLIAILALVALVTKPPPPPNVAEFAPQSVEQITDAPSNQSSGFGAGEGEGTSGTSGTAGLPSAGSRQSVRVRRCVGNPPRQIEDPQSPPCADTWVGNNGGSTWRGVSSDEIRVAVPKPEPFLSSRMINAYETFFNNRFEFYGRKLNLIEGKSDSHQVYQPEVQRARAIAVYEEARAFAAIDFVNDSERDNYGMVFNDTFFDELAERKVLSTDYLTGVRTAARDHSVNSPHQYNYSPPLDVALENVGSWACNALVGRPARFGGPDVQSQTRKFALAVQQAPPREPDASPLARRLRDCGAPVEVVPLLENCPSGVHCNADQTIVARMQSMDITSIFCLCNMDQHSWLMDAVQNHAPAYKPEWLIAGISGNERDIWTSRFQQAGLETHLAHLYGVTGANKINRTNDEPWWWALREGDPDIAPPDRGIHMDIAQGSSATTSARTATYGQAQFAINRFYRQVLLLASGIQQAGPRLTPLSLQKGLHETRFPNPGCGGPPYYQACVGFAPGRYAMVDDYTIIWWNGAVPAEQEARPGAFCYVNMGARYSIGKGNWPSGEQSLFDTSKTCR